MPSHKDASFIQGETGSCFGSGFIHKLSLINNMKKTSIQVNEKIP